MVCILFLQKRHISLKNLHSLMLIFYEMECNMTFNFGHKCTTNESNANHLKSIFNKIILSFRAYLSSSSEK